MRTERPLWTCPECGKRFVTRNIYHSCTIVPLESHFIDRPNARRCFDALLAAIEEMGPVTVVVNKTYISFMTRVRFAGAHVRKDFLRAGVWLKRHAESPRFVKSAQYGRQDFVYNFEIREPADIDAEVRALLAESRLVGDQRYRPESSEGTVAG